MKFVLPMAVTLLLIQLAAAFCISKNQGAKIEQDLYTRGQGLVEAIAGISATFLINYDMTALEDIVTSLRGQDGVQWAVFFDAKSRPLTTTRPDGCEGGSGSRQSDQERVSGQYVP